MKPYTEQQRLRRENIEKRLAPTHGCLTLDDYAESVLKELQSEAVAFATLWESGQMPVLKYDDAFKTWRNEQIQENKILIEERITCTLAWQVLKHIDAQRKESDRLYWSQGNIGSCTGHADAFAHHSASLHWIARGAPLKYCPMNPLVTWSMTKGGSLRGGQTLSEMAKGANEIGHFIERLVGANNQSMPRDYKNYLDDAAKYQSAILFLNFRGDELCEEIFQCCAAGLSVVVGNSNAVSGCTIDKNGIKVAETGGSWAHATHFTECRTVNGTEYVGWVNSHGEIYKTSDEGEPADMCWMDRKTANKFCSTMYYYGAPYVVFPESVILPDKSLYTKQQIPFPEHWKF
jgi:hypothetical protein